jgi:hypothetical protein
VRWREDGMLNTDPRTFTVTFGKVARENADAV